MTIARLMTERDRIALELAAMPPPVGSTDDAWERVFDRMSDLEDMILVREAATFDDFRSQVAILVKRAADGLNVDVELMRLAVPRALA